jgi:hypothetical protein
MTRHPRFHLQPLRRLFAAAAVLLALPIQAQPNKLGAPLLVYAVTEKAELIKFDAASPGKILTRARLKGLADGESLVGIDYRVARGILYALSSQGRLYTLDPASGALARVGNSPEAIPLRGNAFGFDFNPTVDRIRVVSDAGQNLRLHPDTGAVVDADPKAAGVQPDGALRFAAGDANAGRAPDVVAAAYTYNQKDPKLTTNYAIDRKLGALLTQGTLEGAAPPVSPNTGELRTVGALGTGPLADASFDISDVTNVAIVAARPLSGDKTLLLRVDLSTGKALPAGAIGDGGRLVGIAIEP